MQRIPRTTVNSSYGDPAIITREIQKLCPWCRHKSSPRVSRVRKTRLCKQAFSMLQVVRELTERDADFINKRRGIQRSAINARPGELRSGWHSRREHVAGGARVSRVFVHRGE